MKGVRLTPPQVRAIARVWTGTPKNEARLAKLYGVGPRALRLIARRGGNRRATKKPVRWTPEAVATLRARYAGTPTRQLVDVLGKDYQAIWRKARDLGLLKDPAVVAAERARAHRKLAEAGKAYRIKPGAVPPNKGKKMPAGYAPGRMRETQFRKGQANHNRMPIGAEREIDGYLYRKVADVRYVPHTVNWKLVHVLAWEAHHGKPVPPGHRLRFRDGDRRNVDVANLELVTFADSMARNTIHRYPPELKDAIRLQARLERTIERRQAA